MVFFPVMVCLAILAFYCKVFLTLSLPSALWRLKKPVSISPYVCSSFSPSSFTAAQSSFQSGSAPARLSPSSFTAAQSSFQSGSAPARLSPSHVASSHTYFLFLLNSLSQCFYPSWNQTLGRRHDHSATVAC